MTHLGFSTSAIVLSVFGALIPLGIWAMIQYDARPWWKRRQHFTRDRALFAAAIHMLRDEPMHGLLLILASALVFAALAVRKSLLPWGFALGFAIVFFDGQRQRHRAESRLNPYPWVFRRRSTRWNMSRQVQTKHGSTHDFDPISLGTVHFGFALSLWTAWATSQTKDGHTFGVAVAISLISVAFFVAVYSERVRGFLNTQGAPLVWITFMALPVSLIFSILETLPSFEAVSLPNQVVIGTAIYLGFAWMTTILLAVMRDTRNELILILVLSIFFVFGLGKIIHADTVNRIGGSILLGIVPLAYLVATRRLRPYGKVFEK